MSAPIKSIVLALALASLAFAIGVLFDVVTFNASTALLTGLGALALAGAASGLSDARHRPDTPSTPVPERRVEATVPETSPAEALSEFEGRADTDRNEAYTTWIALRRIAAETLSRYTKYDDASATEAIDAGAWTDDETAARYLATDESSVEDAGLAIRERFTTGRDRLRRGAMRARVERTVDAIAAIQREAGRIDDRTTIEDSNDDRPVGDVGTRTTTRALEESVPTSRVETGHWWGVGSIALGLIGLGAIAELPGLLLAGTVAVGYAGFARSSSPDEPKLDVERTVAPEEPDPGERVTVETTLTNRGPTLFDVRFIDGVPGALSVEEGSPRIATPLRAGASVTVTYEVEARPGTHAFDPAMVIVGDASRSSEVAVLVPESTTIACRPRLEPAEAAIPLRLSAIRRTGQLTIREGGSGTDFHSVRAYQSGDPINRIDWNRHARTGELATIQFHTERATRVLLVIDSRREAYVAPTPSAMHAVDRSVGAAGRIAASLLDDGDAVGLSAIGPTTRSGGESADGDEIIENTCWIPPAAGPDHRLSLRTALTGHPQFSTVPAPASRLWISQLGELRQHLRGETQVILFTPLSDFGSVLIARRFASRGHPVTVVSPDPTTETTPETQLARLCRTLRRDDLQRNGIPVLDWPADERIEALLERYANRGVVR
ncbi:DUF58 domain-containing protein [Halovivax limisalsi]|uniref:DUF58 domain-containing protein n=1 Tax=Halovivax limisalsi TaxID=1453760 RepID=UPI001FFC4D55|nr:DUF58 domain-containing protein [Halovivax limisalsi]